MLSTNGPYVLASALLIRASARIATCWTASDALESGLQTLCDEGRSAWPNFEVPALEFCRFVGERLRDGDEPDVLRDLHSADLYLACACLRGEPTGLAALETLLFTRVPDILRGASLESRAPSDDVAQIVRQQLLVPDLSRKDERPKLASYSGRGELRKWFKVVVVRAARNMTRGVNPDTPVAPETIAQFAIAGRDLELDYLKQRYERDFRTAFERALRSLPTRDRTLLRLHYVDGMSVTALATVYRVHRGTVSRWLSETRAMLSGQIRHDLGSSLGLDTHDVSGVVRLVESRLDFSLRSQLRRASAQ